MNFETSLRKSIYDVTRQHGTPPTIAELATQHRCGEDDIRDALGRLALARVVVLQPESGELLMVPPLSAVPTPFVVHTASYSAYANCAWDALGVPAMLHQDVNIASACGCCGESIDLTVEGTETPQGDGVIHFAVPAKRWWEDVVFT